MQETEQRAEHGMPSYRWPKGVSGNPEGKSKAARQARIDAKVAELAADFGGVAALSNLDRVYLEKAAELLLRRPRSAEHVIRHTNSIQRLIAAVELRRGNKRQSESSLADTLKHGATS
jgi:hypothetical protein